MINNHILAAMHRYEPLYKFSHILDEFADEPKRQLELIVLRLQSLKNMFKQAKTEEFREMLYDDMNELNAIFGRIHQRYVL